MELMTYISQVKTVTQVLYFMQVPHLEVTERVSSILKDNGFSPTSEWIEIGNLYVLITDCFVCIQN